MVLLSLAFRSWYTEAKFCAQSLLLDRQPKVRRFFLFQCLVCCETGSKPVFRLLMSLFKIEEQSSLPGSKTNNMRMSLHGWAHLLWNFSPLKWGILELGLQWEQFLRGKSYGETSLRATRVSGGMASVLILAADCHVTVGKLLMVWSFLFIFFSFFLKWELQNYLHEGHGWLLVFTSLMQATAFSLSFPYFSFGGYDGVFPPLSDAFSLVDRRWLHGVMQVVCTVTRSTCRFRFDPCPAVLGWEYVTAVTLGFCSHMLQQPWDLLDAKYSLG